MCLLLRLRSATPIQTESSDEGGQKQEKNLYNILSGPQRTVQNKKQRQFMTPLNHANNMMHLSETSFVNTEFDSTAMSHLSFESNQVNMREIMAIAYE